MASENDRFSDEPSTGQAIGSLAKDVVLLQFSWESLLMAQKGYRRGFFMPGTRGGFAKVAGKYKGGPSLGRFGRRMGIWGKEGAQFVKPIEKAGLRTLYEEGGLLGFSGARKAAAAAFGENLAANAGAKYLVSRAAGLVIGYSYLQLGLLAGGALIGGYKAISRQVTKYRGLELGGYFPETQAAYTSRQRAVRAITESQLQAKSAIGNEAMLFHH